MNAKIARGRAIVIFFKVKSFLSGQKLTWFGNVLWNSLWKKLYITIIEKTDRAKAKIIDEYFIKLIFFDKINGRIIKENTNNITFPFKIKVNDFCVIIPSKTFCIFVPNTLNNELYFF